MADRPRLAFERASRIGLIRTRSLNRDLFDQLVGTHQDSLVYFQAELPGRLQVHGEPVLGGHLHGKIGWLDAPEYLDDERCAAARHYAIISRVRDQSPDRDEAGVR